MASTSRSSHRSRKIAKSHTSFGNTSARAPPKRGKPHQVGTREGYKLGIPVAGAPVGCVVGRYVGETDGMAVGSAVGPTVFVGDAVGIAVATYIATKFGTKHRHTRVVNTLYYVFTVTVNLIECEGFVVSRISESQVVRIPTLFWRALSSFNSFLGHIFLLILLCFLTELFVHLLRRDRCPGRCYYDYQLCMQHCERISPTWWSTRHHRRGYRRTP